MFTRNTSSRGVAIVAFVTGGFLFCAFFWAIPMCTPAKKDDVMEDE